MFSIIGHAIMCLTRAIPASFALQESILFSNKFYFYGLLSENLKISHYHTQAITLKAIYDVWLVNIKRTLNYTILIMILIS